MKIIIETIPHKDQRYPTVGDWFFTRDEELADDRGILNIKVSEMVDVKHEFLVALHEMIEAFICKTRRIDEEDVTNFDKKFECMRRDYPEIVGDREPGNSHSAPYRKEHQFATKIEAKVAKELGVDWSEYDEAVKNL